ncbi:hypothetical protein C8R48DRAFT_674285 [Suillus tomentosus]|nr:hypothetical protein C8R48DRAFT_674285 [Suillus tomentosus]
MQASCRGMEVQNAGYDNHHIYKAIDDTPLSDVKWQSFTIKYTGDITEEGAALWMTDSHEVWFHDPRKVVRNMLASPDFAAEMDLRPYHEFATENDEHQWKDFMSRDWAYKQADMISEDPNTYGSMFILVILGSDKKTIILSMHLLEMFRTMVSCNAQNTYVSQSNQTAC